MDRVHVNQDVRFWNKNNFCFINEFFVRNVFSFLIYLFVKLKRDFEHLYLTVFMLSFFYFEIFEQCTSLEHNAKLISYNLFCRETSFLLFIFYS